MPKCNSCDGDLLRTDAFCGTCGEPVPGAKPVVPIARDPNPSGVHESPGESQRSAAAVATIVPQTGAQAAVVVALSEPLPESEPQEPDETGLTQTTIREREPSEPAPVLPLHRKKVESLDTTGKQTFRSADRTDPSVPDLERETLGAALPPPPGPPILASDLLRERLRPRAPGETTLRRVAVGFGTAGIVGALFSGGAQPLSLVALALLVGILTIALTPMSYRGRAISLFLVGTVATSVALWQQTLHGVAAESIALATATILLSGSLLFRAYYRGAKLARVAVSTGVLMLCAWFFLSGGHESLVRLGGHWQSWAPAFTHMAFGLLALLSLMAFMDSTTRGGAHWWAYALLALYTVHIALRVAIQGWPHGGAHGGIPGPTIAAIVAGVVGTVVASVALAQVFVVAYNAVNNRARDPGT